jgi:MFS transporter, ACS family, hexuronate transporter
LENDLGYSREFVGYFTAVYYAATFVGSLASGGLISLLSRRGWNVHRARMATFLLFSLLTAASIPAALWLGGYWYLGTMLLVGFGSLGLFPVYYSLTQEISAKHQGKVGGTLSFATWSLLSVLHPMIGEWVSKTPEIRPTLLATLGAAPLLAALVLNRYWGRRPANAAGDS